MAQQQWVEEDVDLRTLGYINRASTTYQLLYHDGFLKRQLENFDAVVLKNDAEDETSTVKVIVNKDVELVPSNNWTLKRAQASSAFFHIMKNVGVRKDGTFQMMGTVEPHYMAHNIVVESKYDDLVKLMICPGIEFLARPLAQNLPAEHPCHLQKIPGKYDLNGTIPSSMWSCYLSACVLVDFYTVVENTKARWLKEEQCTHSEPISTLGKALLSIGVASGQAKRDDFRWQSLLTAEDQEIISSIADKAKIRVQLITGKYVEYLLGGITWNNPKPASDEIDGEATERSPVQEYNTLEQAQPLYKENPQHNHYSTMPASKPYNRINSAPVNSSYNRDASRQESSDDVPFKTKALMPRSDRRRSSTGEALKRQDSNGLVSIQSWNEAARPQSAASNHSSTENLRPTTPSMDRQYSLPKAKVNQWCYRTWSVPSNASRRHSEYYD